MTEMDGGELEIIKMEKYAGMKALTEGSLKPEVGRMMMILLVMMILTRKDYESQDCPPQDWLHSGQS